MSQLIFTQPYSSVMLPSTENNQGPNLVSIVSHNATSGSSTNITKLPLLAVSLETADRIQVDCSLDGIFHILKAEGGWGACSLTFMDAIQTCVGSSVASPLYEYLKLRRRNQGTVIDVTIYPPKGHKVTFSGYLLSVRADIQKQQNGIATLQVTYNLLGDLVE